MNLKKIFISIIVVFILIISFFTIYIHYEKERKQQFLTSTLAEKSDVKRETYDITSSSYTYFGYVYELEFKDEPNIEYAFYVKDTKSDSYSVLYYSYKNNSNNNPKRDNLFKNTINGE